MKKLLVVMLVLAMASIASAQMELSNFSATTAMEGDDITFDISAGDTQAQGLYYLGILDTSVATGDLDITNALVVYAGVPSSFDAIDDSDTAAILAVLNPFASASLCDTVAPIVDPLGDLVTGIKLANLGGSKDDVITLGLFNGDGTMLDSQDITIVVPEPITIGLLGLGGLFLRRRK